MSLFPTALHNAWSKMFMTHEETDAYRKADAFGKRVTALKLLRRCNKALTELAFIPSILSLTEAETTQLRVAVISVADTFFDTSREVKTSSSTFKEILKVFSATVEDLRGLMEPADIACMERQVTRLMTADLSKAVKKGALQVEKSISNVSDAALAAASFAADEATGENPL